MGSGQHNDPEIGDDVQLLRAYGHGQLKPELAPGQTPDDLEEADLLSRIKGWGFGAIEDPYSSDVGASAFIEHLLPSPDGVVRLKACFERVSGLPQLIVRLRTGDVREIEIPNSAGERLGIVMAPLPEDDDYFEFGDAHVHILRADRNSQFGKGAQRRLARLTAIVLR